MSPLPPPTAPAPLSPKRRSRGLSGWVRWSKHPDTRAVQIGVVATLLVHLVLLVFAPKIEQLISPAGDQAPADDWASKEFQIELAPSPTPAAPEPPRVSFPQFVEANPSAPDNAPDKTDLVAAQNQQAAQLVPTPAGKSDAPSSKGDPTAASTVLVNGHSSESRAAVTLPSPPQTTAQTPPEPAKPETAKPEQAKPEKEPARRAQAPLRGTAKIEGDNPTGYGSSVAPAVPGASAVPAPVEGQADAKSDTGSPTGIYYKVDSKHPQSRPTLAPSITRGRASPLADRALGTDNVGAVAYSAKWSAYGDYMQKLIETVDSQWKRILDSSTVYPPEGTKVTVVFRLNAKGEISEIVKVSGGDGGRGAQDACVSAIVARAPYGAWSDDMIGVLGDSQEITFSFLYD